MIPRLRNYYVGEKADAWRGMKAGYSAKHKWLTANYGRPTYCENDPSHPGKIFDWANLSGLYLRERSDYKHLCRRCHRLMDRGNFCKHGHEYTPENTLIKQKKGENPYRQCRECNKLWMRVKRGGFNPNHHLAKP